MDLPSTWISLKDIGKKNIGKMDNSSTKSLFRRVKKPTIYASICLSVLLKNDNENVECQYNYILLNRYGIRITFLAHLRSKAGDF